MNSQSVPVQIKFINHALKRFPHERNIVMKSAKFYRHVLE